MRTLTFRQFSGLLRQEDYTGQEIRHLYRRVKSGRSELRRWVVTWFYTGELPQNEVEGITAGMLVRERGLRPLNAMLTLDWLGRDPAAAKYFLTRLSAPIAADRAVSGEMDAFLTVHGLTPPPEPDTDRSDLQG